jgi:hypothetical protein
MRFILTVPVLLIVACVAYSETPVQVASRTLNSTEECRKQEIALIKRKGSESAFNQLKLRAERLSNTWMSDSRFYPDSFLVLKTNVSSCLDALNKHIWAAKTMSLIGDDDGWVVEDPMSQSNSPVDLNKAEEYEKYLGKARDILAKWEEAAKSPE